MDVSKEALRLMEWNDGTLGGFDARVYRISFSGELSYETAVPAGQGMAFWNTLLEVGAEFGVTVYGTEALHVMRAEKGFIIGFERLSLIILKSFGILVDGFMIGRYSG